MERIALLYRVVLGRAADVGGLAVYRARFAATPANFLPDAVASMMDSAEFRDGLGGFPAADRLCWNALGRTSTVPERAIAAQDLAMNLISSAEVLGRHSLDMLFPDGMSPDDPALYTLWLKALRQHRATLPSLEKATLAPVLSVIVMPTTPLVAGFAASAASIDSQWDQRLELLVTCPPWVDREALQAACANRRPDGTRIVRTLFRPSPARVLNKALRRATGQFVCLLREGDCLDPGAVAAIARVSAEAEVVLADEDDLDGPASFARPALNGGWDEDAAMSGPPRGAVIVRTALLRRFGGFHATDSAHHEWDVLLRLASVRPARTIIHIPDVVRHRTAREASPDRDRPLADRDVVRRHLDRTGRGPCDIETSGDAATIRVVFPVPAVPPLVSVIVPTRDRAALLDACLAGVLQRTDYPAVEVLIVDNESREDATRTLFARLARDRRVRILRSEGPFNWSALNNAAVADMRGDVAVLLNNDVDVIDRGWLRELVSHAIRPEVGAVGAKLLYPDRTIQHAGIGLAEGGHSVHLWRGMAGDAPGYLDRLRIVRTVAAVTGACLAIRRRVYEQVGGLEQDNLKVTWSDTDLCLKVRQAGYKVVWTPHALLHHVELATRGSDEQPEARSRFLREKAFFSEAWKDVRDLDPYRSPYLVLSDGPPRLDTSLFARTSVQRA